MATDSYLSPASLAPKIENGGVPTPLWLQGQQFYDATQNYQDAVSLQRLMGQMSAQQQNLELQKTQATQPGAISAVNAQNDALSKTIMQQKRGEAASADAAGQLALGTVGSNIAATNSKNDAQLTEDQHKKLQSVIQIAQTASALGGNPTMAPVVQKMFQDVGIDPNSPTVQATIKDPEGVTKKLMGISQAYQEKKALQTQAEAAKKDEALAVQEKANEGTKTVAGINANARITSAELYAQQRQTFQTLATAAMSRVRAAQSAGKDPDPTDVGLINWVAQQEVTVKAAGAAQTGANTGAIAGLPTAPPVTAAPFPTAPSAVPGPDVALTEQQVKSAGWDYEPQKYDYKLINGRVARKPKAK